MNLIIENPILEQKFVGLLEKGHKPDEIIQIGVDMLESDKMNVRGKTLTGITWEEFFNQTEPLPENFSVDRNDLYHDDNKVRF